VIPPQESGVTAVSHVIELAIAPVFLLSAIGAVLGVLTSRLSRIIDRARVLESQLDDVQGRAAGALQDELDTLSQRAMLVHRAITLAISTAVLVCSTIVALFLGAFVDVDVSLVVGLLFIGAMVAFLGALITLMRELLLAVGSLRFGRK
jgi:hypothetical protein